MQPSVFARFSVAVILGLGILAAGFAGLELALRFTVKDHFAPVQPCVRFGNARFHHLYIANCKSTHTVEGREVEYQFNEMGLRERPLNTIGSPRIAVLGDSEVKGLYSPVELALPRIFEETLNGKAKFLNLGVRFSGPILQAALYKHLARGIRADAVVWFINGTDPMEERYFTHKVAHRDLDGLASDYFVDDSELSQKHPGARLSYFFGGEIEIFNYWYRNALFSEWRKVALSTPPSKEVLCDTIFKFSAYLKKRDVPLLFVFAPKPHEGLEWYWLGEKYDPAQLAMMAECARETGSRVVDLSERPLDKTNFYADMIHYREPGARWLAHELEPELLRLIHAD